MPHALRLKDGKLITPFDLEDVLEIVEEYAGDEVRQYLAENLSDTDALEKELDRLYREHEEDLERLGDHQRAVLNAVREEAESLGNLLDAQRLDRRKLKKATDNIWRMCDRELWMFPGTSAYVFHLLRKEAEDGGKSDTGQK